MNSEAINELNCPHCEAELDSDEYDWAAQIPNEDPAEEICPKRSKHSTHLHWAE